MSMAFTSESGATSGGTSGSWDFYRWLARTYEWKGGTRAPKGISFCSTGSSGVWRREIATLSREDHLLELWPTIIGRWKWN